MKNKLVLMCAVLMGGANLANAETLVCWSQFKADRPAIVATVLGDDLLSNVTAPDTGLTLIPGVIRGAVNPRARKYAGYFYFGYR